MNNKEIITIFAARFVNKAFRERFIHEATKRPSDLRSRICHCIQIIFDQKFEGNSTNFLETDNCLFLGPYYPITSMTWKEAKDKTSNGGGGFLVIKDDATAFYAETEAYPAIVYAGNYKATRA